MVKKNGSSGDEEKEFVVITLRIDRATKKRLHAYCLQRSEDEDKRVSYNAGIIELIQATKPRPRPRAQSR